MIIPGVVAHASRPVPTVVIGAATNTTAAPTVTTSAATNYNQNSATLNGSTSTGTLSYLYGISSTPSTVSASGALTGLSNGTLYYFRAVGTNNAATASLSGTVTTTTSTDVSFQYGTSSGTYTNEVFNSTVTSASANTVTSSISGLTPGTTYYFRIKASTTVGFVYSEEASFTASNATAQGAVLSFTTYSFRSYSQATAGTYTWTNPTPTNGAPINTIYNVVLIGGGAKGGPSGQGRLITSINISGNQTVVVGHGGGTYSPDYGTESGLASSVAGQSAAGGFSGDFYNPPSSGDGFPNGITWEYGNYFSGGWAYAFGGGGGASGAGTNGNGIRVAENTYDLYGGNGGPGKTLTWTKLNGTSGSYAYGGGGAGATNGPGPYVRYTYDGVGGGYGGNPGIAGTDGRGGGGGKKTSGTDGNGGSGYVYFEYWGP